MSSGYSKPPRENPSRLSCSKVSTRTAPCSLGEKYVTSIAPAAARSAHPAVDGGSDENPKYRETRFLLAELVLGGPDNKRGRRKMAAALTREANGTYKQVVERVNGAETIAAAGFHPSTEAYGDLLDEETGAVDPKKVDGMIMQNAEDYRRLLDGADGINNATISAFHGANAGTSALIHDMLERRPILLAWLDPKTSTKKRNELAKVGFARRAARALGPRITVSLGGGC